MIAHSLVESLRDIVGPANVLSAKSDLLVYECDGFIMEKNSPDVVVFPENTEHVVAIVQLCNEAGVPFLPRGAGTSLAGGALPIGGGVMIVMTKMKEKNSNDNKVLKNFLCWIRNILNRL